MPKSNHQIPSWLKLIMENSWELELLISGGAIFSLFQLSGNWVQWFESTVEFTAFLGQDIILIIGTLGLELLKIGFITHILFRAFWLAMVCANYVYPNGIKKEKIKWKKPFRIYAEDEEDLQLPIIKLDRYCGIVIYLSITSSILLLGIIATIFLLISIPSLLDLPFANGFYNQFVILFILLYILDLFTSGFLRKIPYFSYLIFPLFSIFDVLSFRKFIQKSAFLFFTNIPKVKFFSLTAVMLSIGLLLSYLNTYKSMHWPNVFDKRQYKWQLTNKDGLSTSPAYYRNEAINRYRGNPSIQSKIVHDNFLDLFIPYNVHYDAFMEGIDKKKEDRLFSDLPSISLNNVLIDSLQWHESWRDSENGIARHIGIESFVSIGHLKDGQHKLKVSIRPSVIKNLEKKGKISAWERKRLEGLEILFIKDTQVSISP